MDTYFIGYDLVEEKDYDKLITKLQSMGAKKVILSEWCLQKKGTTCEEIMDILEESVDSDDRLVVTQIVDGAFYNALYAPTKPS